MARVIIVPGQHTRPKSTAAAVKPTKPAPRLPTTVARRELKGRPTT